MRVAVTAFLLGAVAMAALSLGGAFVVLALAEASGRDALRLALLGVELLSFERTPLGSETSFGPGLWLLSLVGGAVNAAAAAAIERRRRGAT